jgi:hypothetical protein
MPHPFHSQFDHPNNIWWGVQISDIRVIEFSPFPYYPVLLRPKYSPQHSILKHIQPTFLSVFERPCFTPIYNSRQNYSYVSRNLLHFWIANSKT